MQIATNLGVHPLTVRLWKKKQAEVRASLFMTLPPPHYEREVAALRIIVLSLESHARAARARLYGELTVFHVLFFSIQVEKCENI